MTTFKEITHFHIGCLMQSVVDGQRFTHTVPWDSNNSHYKPILIPMDKMSEADAAPVQIFDIPTKDEEFQFSAEDFAFLLSRHYNVFNLPPEEFIDATSLPGGNPYEQ
jgi:hypothetical protein